MNNKTAKARAAVKRSGGRSGARSGARVLSKRAVIRVDWALRRLRNQAVKFFAKGDRALARVLRDELKDTRSYSQVENLLRDEAKSRGLPSWSKFMDAFFGHQINRHA